MIHLRHQCFIQILRWRETVLGFSFWVVDLEVLEIMLGDWAHGSFIHRTFAKETRSLCNHCFAMQWICYMHLILLSFMYVNMKFRLLNLPWNWETWSLAHSKWNGVEIHNWLWNEAIYCKWTIWYIRMFSMPFQCNFSPSIWIIYLFLVNFQLDTMSWLVYT